MCDDQTSCSHVQLPPELLQVVGCRLSTAELRNARLVCTGWATALAHCMPAVTVALPRQASDRIFRQPLVLCSSGVLNSAQCQDYNAVPRAYQHRSKQPVLGICRRRSSRNSVEGCNSTCCKRTCTAANSSISNASPGFTPGAAEVSPFEQQAVSLAAAPAECQPVSRDKPSPFATELGQAVLDCLLEDPILTVAAPGTRTAHLANTPHTDITLPARGKAIKAAISMPPLLAEQAAAVQQQQAMQADQQPMRKLASVPASNLHPVPRTTRHVSKPGRVDPTGQQLPAGQQHVVAALGPMIQGWSSLPVAGLRTCSSLKQLHLKLSGAPPSPADILDLSKLLHLTHLSFKQVDVPDADDMEASDLEEDCGDLATPSTAGCSTAGIGGCGAATSNAADEPAAASVLRHCHSMQLGSNGDLTAAATSALEGCHLHSPHAATVDAGGTSCTGRLSCTAQLDALESAHTTVAAAAGCAVHVGGEGSVRSSSSMRGGGALGLQEESDDDVRASVAAKRDQAGVLQGSPAGGLAGSSGVAAGPDTVATRSISCSVITAEHVLALAQLPHLSSLELAPKNGVWDAAGREGLLQLAKLTGLTRLCITWGDAAKAPAPLSRESAAAAAQEDQLPLQRCLAGLTGLQELSIHGAAVVDVAVLQRLQELRTLTADGLQVVNSDVMAMIGTAGDVQQATPSQPGQQQAGGVMVPQLQPQMQSALSAAAAQGPAPGTALQQQGGRWASLPHLRYVHTVHLASDISLLLQSTVTPQLSHLGFVSRGPSDFARLLGQHGKLRTLHLSFADEESWHPIAVVRLPTALPSLQSLTIEGKFWLPNSLIVALGVMEVPLEHLSLTCRLAPPCLQRLQHLKQLKRLALHHVPAGPAFPAAPTSRSGSKANKGPNDTMLQLPAKLLPPQLQELEISNGWILH